jgi:beta-glucanase (GH16 family)
LQRAGLAVACLIAVLVAGLTVASSPATGAAPRQRATLSVSPGIAQNGTHVASANGASLLGEASFSPARRGRPVLVQQRVGRSPWRTVMRTREDAHGRVRFVRDDKRGSSTPYVYRVAAVRYGALRAVYSNAGSSASWRLRFDEPFDGDFLDLDTWDYRLAGRLQGTRMHAESSAAAVQVGGGALNLQVRANPAHHPDPLPYYLNGHVSTQNKFAFTYGYAAARVKFARGQGQHGAFWLQPQSRAAESGPAALTGTEIDIAEFFGQGYRSGGIANYVYSVPAVGSTHKHGALRASALRALRGRSDTWWSRYHVFSVLWTPRGHIFRVDGVETSRIMTAVSARPQYLLLSLLSSDWELPMLNTRTLPTSMKVDWVRVWQR